MIQGMEHFPSEDSLREMGLLSLEKKRLWGDLRVAFHNIKKGLWEIRKGTDSSAGSVVIGQGEVVSN